MATFNVLHGCSPERNEVDLATFAAAVRDLGADVLALQEVDHHQERSHRADLTAEQPDAAAYGIALLSRHPASAWRVVRLPAQPVPAPRRFPTGRLPAWVRDEPRVAVVATIDGPLGALSIATTHLSVVQWWNGRQLSRLVRSLADVPRPLLLTGDLNMGAARAQRVSGMVGLGAHATFPADRPRTQLDHVLCDRPLRATTTARRLSLSDHLAYVVDLHP